MKGVISIYQEKLDKIFSIKDCIKDIYSSIDELYPIAIVEEGNFYIFDYMIDNLVYELVNIEPTKFPINRVTFYATGSRYISLLKNRQPRLIADIEQLFYEMNKDIF